MRAIQNDLFVIREKKEMQFSRKEQVIFIGGHVKARSISFQ